MAHLRKYLLNQIAIGSVALAVNFLLKLIHIPEKTDFDDDEQEEEMQTDIVKGSKEVNLKRSQKRIETQLSRNHISWYFKNHFTIHISKPPIPPIPPMSPIPFLSWDLVQA